MEAKTIEQAKTIAKAQSLEKKYKDHTIYIIYCNRTEKFYADTDGLVRNWEKPYGYYVNGVYTP